jgi:membrane-associated phospholipid phosphatase
MRVIVQMSGRQEKPAMRRWRVPAAAAMIRSSPAQGGLVIPRRSGCSLTRSFSQILGHPDDGAQFRAWRSAAVLLLGAILGTTSIPAFAHASPPAPKLELSGSDLGITLAGAALLGAGRCLLQPRVLPVPASGLDPAGIHWGLDRRAITAPSPGAGRASNWTLAAATLTPPLFATLAAHRQDGWDQQLRGLRVESEAMLLCAGLTFVLKNAFSRPRPFTYLSESERSAFDGYDATAEAAFDSFPSGHSSTAWAASMAGVAFLVTERPELGAGTHFANGFLAGGLAAATSLLRVEASRHFPTDVAAGAALGSATGIVVALVHADPATQGHRGDAWRAGLLGVGTGILCAILFTPPTSPWVN